MKHETARPAYRSWALIIAASLAFPVVAVGQGAPQPGAEEILSQPRELSNRERLTYGNETITEVRRGVERVQREADAAKRDRDILKLNCLNEKLSDLRALLKVAETAYAQMEVDIQKAQDEAADHEFQRIVIVRKRAADLILKAGECTGEGVLLSGDGQTSITVSSDIGNIDVVDPSDDAETVDNAVDLPDPEDIVDPSTPEPCDQSCSTP